MTNLHEIAAILEDTCSAPIGDREEIGIGSANGVEEEEGTSTLDCRAWSQEEKYRDDVNVG